jgi:hypothetical protein
MANNISIDHSIKTEQQELPLSGLYQCETCFTSVDPGTSIKSRERYDNHTLCFKHQLVYKKLQVRARRMGKNRLQLAQ